MPTTLPPMRSTSSAVARAVPPVARTSSTIKNPLSRFDPVLVDLERRRAVLEVVLRRLRLPGKLVLLSHGDEPGAEVIGHGGREDEAPRLDPDHLVHGPAAEVHDDEVDDRGEGDLSASSGVMSLKTMPSCGSRARRE